LKNSVFSVDQEVWSDDAKFCSPSIVERHKSLDTWTSFADGTQLNFTKLLVLDFFASTIYLAKHKDLLKAPWPMIRVILGLPDDARGSVEDYIQHAEEGDAILKDVQDMADAINFVLSAITAGTSHSIPTSGSTNPQAGTLIRERTFILQNLCSKRLANTMQYLERLHRRFQSRSTALNIQESVSVKRLTILAAVFLPLSLATSILSMQTRFIDLHLLLYDFVGVFTIIGSFSVLIYFIVLLILKFKPSKSLENWEDRQRQLNQSQYQEAKRKQAYSIWRKLLYFILFAGWSTILISFIVGMVVKVTLGLRILGYGMAGVLGCVIVPFAVLIIFSFTFSDPLQLAILVGSVIGALAWMIEVLKRTFR
jgi:hypothetical protein